MADKTGIDYCDATWNPVVGCSPASIGCKNCYAERVAHRFAGTVPRYKGLTSERGKWTGEVRTVPEALDQPLRWRRPRTIMVPSMGDLFHEGVPFEWIAAVWGVMAGCPQHRFLVPTKRPDRAVEWFGYLNTNSERTGRSIGALLSEYTETRLGWHFQPCDTWPLDNVVLIASVENQQTADERIPALLLCPARWHGVSYEPALGPVDFGQVRQRRFPSGGLYGWHDALRGILHFDCGTDFGIGWQTSVTPKIDVIFCGGESGPNARPMDLEWARSARDQCAEAGTSFWYKQEGGLRGGGDLLDGVRHKELPWSTTKENDR